MFESTFVLLDTLRKSVKFSYESRLEFNWIFSLRVNPTVTYVYPYA